jgi:membrane fusion protein (multidrug efflux system)
MSDDRDASQARADSGYAGGDAPKKKGRGRVLIIVVLAAAAVAGYFLFAGGGTQSTDDAAIRGDQIVLSAQTLGQITSLTAEEQDHVAKGQVLVKLDDQTLRAQESQALANKEFAEQNSELAQEKLNQAQSDLDRATAQLKAKIIPQEQYDHLAIAFSSAQTQCKIAIAQQKMAEAQYATVETNLAHMVIASPIDGVVAKKWTMPGNIVQPAQPIYTLYDLKSLWVEANFKETQIRYLKPGEVATISVDAFPGHPLSGKVESVGTATASEFALIPPDNATGNFTKVTQRVPVKIVLDDQGAADPKADPVLVPGLSVEVRVASGAR